MIPKPDVPQRPFAPPEKPLSLAPSRVAQVRALLKQVYQAMRDSQTPGSDLLGT